MQDEWETFGEIVGGGGGDWRRGKTDGKGMVEVLESTR